MPCGYNEEIIESTPFHFFGRFRVSLKDGIYDNLLGQYVNTFKDVGSDIPMVEIPEYFGSVFAGIRAVEAKLMYALAFKGCHLSWSLLEKISVICIDGDESNLHPSNLLWKFPVEGIEVPGWPGFYYIPGYTKQAINKDDDILFINSGRREKARKADVGYSKIYLEKDCGMSMITGLHRIKGYTFLDYRPTVHSDVINHIDTDRENNGIGNLEWVTVEENGRHCIEKYGLPHLNPIAVQVKDNRNGEILSFSSITACARHFETTPSNVYRVVEGNSKGSTFRQHYFIKREDQSWPEFNHDHTNIYAGGRAVAVKELKTGIVTIYKSAMEFIRTKGLSKKVVTTALRLNSQREVGGYIFKYADLKIDWRM